VFHFDQTGHSRRPILVHDRQRIPPSSLLWGSRRSHSGGLFCFSPRLLGCLCRRKQGEKRCAALEHELIPLIYRFTWNSSEQGKLQKLWPQIGFASGHTIGPTVYRLDLRPPSEAALSVKRIHSLCGPSLPRKRRRSGRRQQDRRLPNEREGHQGERCLRD
jgi:hypothetical protein